MTYGWRSKPGFGAGGACLVLLAAATLAGCDSDGPAGSSSLQEPPLETEPAVLEAALRCGAFEHPDKPPVLLVHGTFTNGFEQFDWSWTPFLRERGFDTCTVTYPDRGLGDMQVSAEYVVHALRRMHAETGRRVAVIGHSQGAVVPRWAVKWWPSARSATRDLVLLAGPHRGTDVSGLGDLLEAVTGGNRPAALFQFDPDSAFVAALNRDGQALDGIDYTAIYTVFDELVQPVEPEPTAAIDFGSDNPRVANILVQDICPGVIVDHITIGLTDALTFALALDAISHDGPADVARAGGASLCGLLSPVPGVEIAPLPDLLAAFGNILLQELQTGFGLQDLHLTAEEPPLKPYALP